MTGAGAPQGSRASADSAGAARTLSLRDPGCAEAVAALLGATLGEAPFRHGDGPVPRLLLRNRALGAEVRLDLWPALARVDVAVGDCFFVFTDVAEVLLLPGVEVLFRRAAPRGFLLVTVTGAVALKA